MTSSIDNGLPEIDVSRHALFLDIDGTLIDLAETPEAIIVPDGLPDMLAALSQRLDGALALVTGRALDYADTLFAPHRFPLAGLHGTERRGGDGVITRHDPSTSFLAVKEDLPKLSQAYPGVLVEDKGAAIAVHFRQAPDCAGVLETAMRDALAAAGPGYALQRGKMVMEIRPDSADKGRAVAAFLDETPFKGRIPITFGDDVTDEAMFELANDRDGFSVKIGGNGEPTFARYGLKRPTDMRAFIRRIAES
ncbi:trehalose-phosphatase [Allorhizobium sp. BGMRC 0089]|uniref:trehalose-phosphatase n=1 Tax=Allorhizobium sonneratiae TaxID=2934936 RepID=UPI0020344F4A|nr:trehalose-phosphatase [Allorhizobium sonneratiae]MCM2291605.1 trehalose-phosphatase [Allorhizobium sonneratiae]